MKVKLILTILILLELVLIIYLAIKIDKKRQKTLGTHVVNPINKEALLFGQSEKFKNFYEPEPDSEQIVKDQWRSDEVRYVINSDSLHERFNYPVKKDKKTFRIIALGDSFTFGQSVNTEENWTELLENYLNNKTDCKNISQTEVINLGVMGYDVEYAVERFRIRGEKYDPDLILWFLNINDFTDIRERCVPFHNKYVAEYNNDPTLENYFKVINKSYLECMRGIDGQFLLEYQKKALSRLNNYYQKNKRLVIFTAQLTDPALRTLIREFLLTRENGYFFDQVPETIFFDEVFPDGHLTERGNKLLAERLFKYLTENALIPCH